jgi:tRNA(Ile)-lysidine synthase
MHSPENQPPAATQFMLEVDFSDYQWTDRAVVVAVSGGADSVALLRVLAAAEEHRPQRLIVTHFDHRLRPGAADDARFVADLAGRLKLPFELGEADVASLAKVEGDGIEAAARRARYKFLEEAADRQRAHFIATAHTADDQVETVLHRILRGTGVAGLRGIREVRAFFGRQDLYVVRPLLGVRRKEILEYLREIDQPFCEDPSNADSRFTRNRIRHKLLPVLEQAYNRNVIDAILRLSDTAAGAQSVIDQLVDDLFDEAVSIDDERDAVTVSRDVVLGINPHLVRELFVRIWREMGWPQQQMGLTEWAELALVAAGEEHDADSDEWRRDDEPYKRIFPGQIEAQKNGAELTLTRLQ